MKQVNLIPEISDLFVLFAEQVKSRGALNLTDINVIAEDLLAPVLSIIYDTPLINLNNTKSNYPGIDLATDENITLNSPTKRLAFQITSTKNIDKVKKTIKTYLGNDTHKEFDQLYIYNLIEKQNDYHDKTKTEITNLINGKFKFDLEKDIIDKNDLIKKITTLSPVHKIEQIHKLLKDQVVFNKKSLLTLEIWKSDNQIGYGFSDILESIDLTTRKTLFNNISKEAKDLLKNILEKLNNDFSNNYTENINDKLSNLGFNTYLKAAFSQAQFSFKSIYSNINFTVNPNTLQNELSNVNTDILNKIDESDYPLINSASNHPAIKLIKETSIQILRAASVPTNLIETYTKDFNQNIEETIRNTFGIEDYNKHKELTKDKWIKENEIELLMSIKSLPKLGFIEGEQLKYEQTFGAWQDITTFGKSNNQIQIQKNKLDKKNDRISKLEERENSLINVEELIEEYFDQFKNESEGYLNNILFLIADFGKGKSSFLHQYASNLAKNYIKSHEGLFPIYINLAEYNKYTNSPSLGLIGNFLAKKHKIDISSDYFKKKKYVFLLDSLDESGEISEIHIEKVVKEIIEIQNLDNINRRDNRIIIASRPIAKGLKEQISKYKPFSIPINDPSRGIKMKSENYISIYGFKKNQLNNYINFGIKNYWRSSQSQQDSLSGYTLEVYKKIKNNIDIDFYSELYDKVLSEGELKRPIFGYMLYKLIISNSNFLGSGKVGVYITFLNQLSKEAKHKDDPSFKVTIKEEFIYRNILHASALLWQYKRQIGEQTSLTKADICRTIDEDEIDKSEKKILSDFPDVNSIHFLSHSYLGEAENNLHFQHQSFAEILLAEYYLKVIIKCSIEENVSFEEARVRLSVGLPTDQTIDFFKGLLKLLKESVLGDPQDKETYSKRELLIPLLASMSITTHNKKLYSTRLNATWFEKYETMLDRNNNIISEMIYDFPITPKVLEKIGSLSKKILESPKMYILDEAQSYTVLFKKELISIDRLKENYFEIDKWLALIAGNYLINSPDDKLFFNSRLNPLSLFDLIENSNYFSNNTPEWGTELFRGINMEDNISSITRTHLLAYRIDFSYSYLKNIDMSYSNFNGSSFSNVTFENTTLDGCKITKTNFDNIDIKGEFSIKLSHIQQGIFFPFRLALKLKSERSRKGLSDETVIYGVVNKGPEYSVIGNSTKDLSDLSSLFSIAKYLKKCGVTVKYILESFKFDEGSTHTAEFNTSKTKKSSNKSLEVRFHATLSELFKESDITKPIN